MACIVKHYDDISTLAFRAKQKYVATIHSYIFCSEQCHTFFITLATGVSQTREVAWVKPVVVNSNFIANYNQNYVLLLASNSLTFDLEVDKITTVCLMNTITVNHCNP